MIGNPVFWVVLLAGAGWTAWGTIRWREPVLAALAGALVAWTDPVAFVCFLGLTTLVWWLVRAGRPARGMMAAVIALAAGLAAYKWLHVTFHAEGMAPPLGLSYLIFRLIHVLLEANRAQLPPVRDWTEFVHYAFSPAIFTAGPIERWDHFTAERREKVDGLLAAEALQRIALGLTKKLWVADGLLLDLGYKLDLVVSGQDLTADASPGKLWLGVVLCYLRIYTEFSGYSDIAVGAGLLWGRRIMENFNWPILAVTPSDFWRRWHISLSQWCARYIYMPMLGWLRTPVIAFFGSFLVMGLWHTIGWNRVGWAMWQTVGVMAHVGWGRVMKRPQPGSWREGWPWRVTSWLLTQSFIATSYVFMFRGEDASFQSALVILGRMFGLA
jgi:alginate O-acetyltransferase complex protein AlgI